MSGAEPAMNRKPGPVHADDYRNERGTVDLAERRPSDRAAHGEPEHLDRTAVAPDQGGGGHCQQQVSGQRRMASQVQAIVAVPLPLAVATTTSAVAGLIAMHVTVGAAVIPAMAHTARAR